MMVMEKKRAVVIVIGLSGGSLVIIVWQLYHYQRFLLDEYLRQR
jgi:hypothetical protein